MQIAGDALKEKDSDVQKALELAHSKTRMPGSCTACLVKLNGETGELSALNLGDSGLMIVRDKRVITRTQPQQHFFDCPRQLAAFPEHCEATDYPRDGDMFSLQLQEGDVIIMGPKSVFWKRLKRRLGSDGLWDNVFDDEMLRFASGLEGRKKTVTDLAEGIARLAQRNSLNETFVSPYSVAAMAEGMSVPWHEKILKAKVVDWKLQWGMVTGGKVDDITVIVAEVKKKNLPVETIEQT